VSSFPNSIIRVNDNATYDLIADLSAFIKAHPVKNPEPDDFEPDGTWYGMTVVDGNFYAVEPHHGEVDRITPSGHISRVIDISASQGHIVPTAIAHRGDTLFVGNLNTFPIVRGSSKIYRITLDGKINVAADGLTTVVGVTLDQQGRIYVLENTTGKGNSGPTPGTGKVVRITASGDKEDIATGLFLPTAMTFGPDGDLYVSNVGFGPPPDGLGQVVKIRVRP
jgi:sugar lactone lactonase YvrE